MQDLGIRVLFMGNNFIRLLGGLWITVKISLISVGLSIVFGLLLGMIMTLKNPVVKCLTKIYPDHASAGTAVPGVLRGNKIFRASAVRGGFGSDCIYHVGYSGDGRPGQRCFDLNPEAPI